MSTEDLQTAQAFEAYQARRHFGNLDGVRALAILAVLWHHSPLMPLLSDRFLIASRGFVGVDLFFVLSGFLITTLLLREERAKGRFSLRGFYWRRALRILPVYLLVVGFAVGYFGVLQGNYDLLGLLPYYLFFMANFLPEHVPLLDPTWSLAVEEQFYLLWPAALLVLPRRWVLPVLGALIALNVAGAMGLLAPLGLAAFALGDLWIALPNATYAPILMGAALALVLDRRAGFAALWRLTGARGAALVWAGVMVLALFVLPRDLLGWPNLLLHLSMTLFLSALVQREKTALTPLLRSAPLMRVGQVSYGLYLYHLIGLHIAVTGLSALGMLHPWLVLGVYTAVSMAMAEFSFRFYEARFLALRYRRAQPASPQV